MINYYKWVALVRLLGGKEKKNKIRAFARIGPQSVYVSRALCIIVLRSQGSD